MRAAREPNGPKSTKMLSSTNQGDWKIGENFQTRAVAVGEKTMSQRREIPIKRLTESELQARREKGLCFKCEEKFSPGHRCKKQLRVLLVHEDEDKDDNQFDGRATEEPALIELKDAVELSLNSVVGLTTPGTMKIKGTIRSKEVIILVDSGATHNFLSLELVQQLALPLTTTTSYGVMMGTRISVKGKGICRGVCISMQGLTVVEDFLPLELGNTDVILGMPWLGTLGDVKVNWKMLTMKIKMGKAVIVLKGDPSLSRTEVSLKAMARALQHHSQGVWVELCQTSTTSDLSEEVQEVPKTVKEVLAQHQQIFGPITGLPPSRDIDHAIQLIPGASPVNVRPYRFCIDYRALNKVTVSNRFPIPVIDELLDELHGTTIFSKLDLKSGYHQIQVRQQDIHETAFRTHEGHYEFLVMPFGLTNAPATFQSLMNHIFRSRLRKFVLVFFDDILVYSKDLKEHCDHLQSVLSILANHLLHNNGKKCLFAKPQLEYLGHLVSAKGVAADPNKISAMVEWPTPKSLKELQGFLGLTGYYRRFVEGYGVISWPLTQQLKKDAFNWNLEAEAAFQKLKTAMTTIPVLALPNFSQLFIVETDASGYGLGAVLMQSHRPVAYFSQVLLARERQKSIYERELMAIVLAVQKWRHYLLGRHFIVRTDQSSLKFLLEQRIVNESYQKWSQSCLVALMVPSCIDTSLISSQVEADPHLAKIQQRLLIDPDAYPRYSLDHGILLYKGRLVLPKASPLVPALLQEGHASVVGGHFGFLQTYK
ncbi:Retrovirus-related Pol polyprotein from transposon 297 [Vitis vinifera]|uniref:Retrovirus-related Pol polyprotein from transposon 297 n=1 Tax=Vitis vinifera TaxID=29760 RepID=A0A438K3V9_VITVI|nr:Retrovirus-related Pol polyprotein from transposon 297 [Vitis vinifera]